MKIPICLVTGTGITEHKSQRRTFKILYLLSVSPNSNPKMSQIPCGIRLTLNWLWTISMMVMVNGWMKMLAGTELLSTYPSLSICSRTDRRSTEDFYLGDFYHCSLVKGLKKRITNPEHHKQFHYEPFKLWWTPSGSTSATWVHSELYTSTAFLDAYREVLEVPNEPGCNLEKVMIGMMFASDVTLLTTFRDAELCMAWIFVLWQWQ